MQDLFFFHCIHYLILNVTSFLRNENNSHKKPINKRIENYIYNIIFTKYLIINFLCSLLKFNIHVHCTTYMKVHNYQ